MKHLYIILLILPLIGFGQGFNFKIGTTCIVPFKTNNIYPNTESLTTSKLGVQSSISYDFILQDISDKFSVSPSFTYTLLKSHSFNQTGPISVDLYNYNHLLHFSLNSGYKFYDRITTKFGLSLDSKLSNNIKGIWTYDPGPPIWNDLNDPIINNTIEESEEKFGNNELKLLGFSGNFSVEFQINQIFSVYSTFLFPFVSFEHEEFINSGLEGINVSTLLLRKHMSFGMVLNI